MMRKILISCFLILFCWLDIACAQEIRVAIVHGQYSAEISCEDSFTVIDKMTNKQVQFAEGKYFLHIQNDKMQMEDHSFSNNIVLQAENTAVIKVNKRAYTGKLSGLLSDGKLLIVNSLELEDYLKYVMPQKTMPIWPDEAMMAQIIAARSYALYMLETHNELYDISANDKELVYKGCEAEKPAISKMVAKTEGLYLRDRQGKAAMAITTSSSGGITEAYYDVYGKNISYLQSVKDFDQDSPDYQWEYKMSPVLLQTLLEQNGYGVGKIQSLQLSPLNEPGNDRTATGRVKYLTVSGENGTYQISGTELMRILSLNSNFFSVAVQTPLPDNLEVPIENYFGMEIGRKDIDIKANEEKKAVWQGVSQKYHLLKGNKEEKILFYGYGKGSGIGLSNWGAKGMADASPENTCQVILQHYYPGTVLNKLQ